MQKLESINFIFDKFEYNWQQNFNELKIYLQIHNEYPENSKLATWVQIQRTMFSKDKLDRSKIEKLESIDFIFSVKDLKWEQKFNELVDWKREYLEPYKWPTYKRGSRDNMAEKENNLAVWINRNRKLFRDGTISEERLAKLQSIGFIFDAHQEKWSLKYDEIISYIEKENRWLDSDNKKEAKFLTWISSNSNRQLTSEQQGKYNTLIELQDRYENSSLGNLKKGLEKFKEFIQENNRLPLSIAKTDDVKDERSLYNWMIQRRQAFQDDRLNQAQIDALYDVGLEEFLNTEIERRERKSFDNWLVELQSFYNKNERWPKSKANAVDEQERALGFWLVNQRNWFKGNLKGYSEYSNENYEKLKAIGYDLDDTPKVINTFDDRLNELKNFYEINQRLPRPTENASLYNWICNTRSQMNRCLLSNEKLELLEPFAKLFESTSKIIKSHSERIEELREFVMINDRLPFSQGEETGLYQFMTRLRRKYREGKLSEQEISEINSINSDILGIYDE